MTPERLDEIQKRANAATAGPWVPHRIDDFDQWFVWKQSSLPYYGMVVDLDRSDMPECIGETCISDGRNEQQDEADATFIAIARTDVPDLVAEVRRLQSENAELSRLRAAVGHMQQELNTLRAREMNIDDITDYSEDRAKLKAENEQLKMANVELVEVLRKSLNLEYLTRVVCALDFARTYEDFESRQLRLNSLREQVQAVIAKHGVSL